ncbi:alpha/beta hydrolase [Actinomadura sp. KC216]|uniref:alpha/beta fold hydrolase n=1 Tax=Actinomadura sp. KC216 TaxID=2530370 RepID=UPI001FB71382|nr:alpha/beta hydrolase [Actinomadura sp. KC216]
MLLHGNAGSGATWARVGQVLATEARVIAPDLRGHGASVRPEPGGYALRAVADDVEELLRALGLHEPLLVGHSWGAAVALVLASGAEAILPTPSVSGLVLVDPPAGMMGHEIELRRLQRSLTLPREVLRRSLHSQHPGWDPRDVESMIEGFAQADPLVVRSLVEDGSTPQRLLPLLAEITVPVLLLRADPRHGGMLREPEWTAERTVVPPNCRVEEFPGAAHMLHFSHFDAFVGLLQDFAAELAEKPTP